MKTMVCFRTVRGQFALPIESTLSVRSLDGLVDLPSPRDDIVGVLPGQPPLSVLSTLGVGGDHILVIEDDGVRYGLRVLEVLGVRRFEDDQIGPPPKGQSDGLISATVTDSDVLVLVADAKALACRL
jgi:chemotaxis signal transduction protein